MRNPFRRKQDVFASPPLQGVIKDASVKQRKRGWLLRARWRWITAAVLVVLLSIGGYGVYLFYRLQGKIQVDIPTVVPQEDDLAPFNVLLVGSDSRAGLSQREQERLGADDETPEGPISGQRADTLILAHIDPQTQRITMVQFPRDLYVPIANGDTDKINSALESGHDNLVATVTQLTGIEINNYARVNIAGFRDLVDAIGGVKVCITEPIPFDPMTGIQVTEEELPVVEFDGERALRFVRSRNFPTSDFERIQNQQKFLSAAISKVISAGTFLNLGRLKGLYNVAIDSVRTDEGTTPLELYRIGQRFRSFDPDRYEAYTAPNFGSKLTEAGESIVVPDELGMERLFDALADNVSPAEADGVPDIDVNTISVGVYNGSPEAGVAIAAAEELKAATTVGSETVEVVEVADAPRKNFRPTVIRFDPSEEGAQEKAELIYAALPDAIMKEGATESADVEVIVGSRPLRTARIVQLRPIPLPPPGDQPERCRQELATP